MRHWRLVGRGGLALAVFVGSAVFAVPSLAQQGTPQRPSAVTVTRAGDTLTASWDAPGGATKYHVTYSSDGKKSWNLAAFDHAAASIAISGIDVAKSYVVAVRAGNEHGWSGWRNSAPNVPSGPPARVGYVSLSRVDGAITASWNSVVGADKYHVTYSSDGKKSWSLAAAAHTSTSITISVQNQHAYVVGVRAGKTSGNSTLWGNWRNSWSSPPWVPTDAPPAAPASVTLNRGCDSFSLSWTPVSGATGYDVNVSHNNRKSWQRALSNVTYTTWNFAKWNKNKPYTVAVRARNGGGVSGWTNSATVAPPPCEVNNLRAVTATVHGTAGGTITTTWNPATRASAYNVNYRPDGGQWQRINSNVAATAHTGTVTSTGGYTVAVQSTNGSAMSKWRNTRIGGWLTASSITGTGATLTLSGHSGDWHVKETSPATDAACSSAVTATTHTLAALFGNTDYVFTAYRDAACADAIGTTGLTTGAATALPSAPATPALTTGDRQLTANWTAPAHNGSPITDYDLRYRVAGTTTWSNAFIRGASYSPGSLGNWKASNGSTGQALDLGNVSLSGLTVAKVTTGGVSNVYKISEAFGALRVKLTAKNSRNNTMTYRARYASTAPTTSNMNTHGTLLWEQTVGYAFSFTGDARLLAQPANTHFWVTTTTYGLTDHPRPTIQADAVTVPSTLTATITGLANNTNYDVQVRAVNTFGLGAWSPSGTQKTGLPDQPAAPTLVSGNQRMTVNWAAGSGNGSAITDYDMRYSSDGGSTWTNVEMDSAANTARSYTITSLNNNTAYTAQIRATNSVGDSLWSPSSAPVEAGTPDPPTAPTLTPGAGQVTATWTAPADNGSTITDYDLQYCAADCTTASNWTFVENGTSTSTTATITNLAASMAYQVQVRAANARGDSGWSPSTTLATLTLTEIADTTATLRFAAGSHTGDWYLKKTAPAPAGTCSSAITGTTQSLSSLTRNTAHTYQAYSDSGCTTVIALITFSTLPSSLTASSVSNNTATLTIGHHTGNWYAKEVSPSTAATCSSAISGTTHDLSGLADGVRYRYEAYSDSGCTTRIARSGSFDTTLHAPTGVSHSTECFLFTGCTSTVTWSRNSSTSSGSVGYQVQFQDRLNTSWTNWQTVQPTTSTSLSHNGDTFDLFDARVRAFRTAGGVTVYSAWQE